MQLMLFISLLAWGSSVYAGMFSDRQLINGAGATFPYPLYSKWFSEYQKVDQTVSFNYQSIGSGGGVRQLMDQTIDFAGSDAYLSDEQIKKSKAPVFHFPTVLGAVVVTYKIPGLTQPLKLTGPQIADIFLGKIQSWNHESLLTNNPELKTIYPAGSKADILVVHRSDGSGTTSIFSEFLSKVSAAWKDKVGKGTALRWPVGIGGRGNEGVSAFVKQIPGSIGYVELVFAHTLKLPFAAVENPRKQFVLPSENSVKLAAEGIAKQIPKDFRASVTWVDSEGAYPISSFTFIITYQKINKKVIIPLKKFLLWSMGDAGQGIAEKLLFVPLPAALVTRVKDQIEAIAQENNSEH
jgi:phosphate transport system substrate-binding protein